MDRKLTLHIKREQSAPPANIRRVHKWGDDVLVDMLDADTGDVGSNFQIVKTVSFNSAGVMDWNCISRFQIVDRGYLRSLQRDGGGYTVQQKMNWLGEGTDKGRPYFERAQGLAFGPFVFGGQLIQTGETITRWGRYPGRDRDEDIKLHRLIGLRRADFGKGYTYATHPHLIQRATEAGKGNVYIQFPKGEMFHPVWSDLDFPANYGDGKLWIAEAFLE